jgi:hydrogenase maturation protease
MKILAIGYGNTLRGDDGVGPLVAERLAAQNLPNLESLAVPQLMPELAADMAQVEIVLFIDACVGEGNRNQSPPELGDLGSNCKKVATSPISFQPLIKPLFPAPSVIRLDHAWSPSVLLHLSKTLYGANPSAYQILIPVVQFDYGATLSAIARNGMNQAIEIIQTIVWETISSHA